MKVYKVADIVNNEVVFCVAQGWKQGDLTVILTNLQPVIEPRPDSAWQMEMIIGKGPAARRVMLDLPQFLSVNDSLDCPLLLADNRLVFYRDRLFMPERAPKSAAEREEIILRTKKLVYGEQADLASLKAAVANLEAAIQYTRLGPKRDPIPEDVKLLVWARDGGACVRCGAKNELHFDHIIPVAKGGGNVEANIQILCQPCNLKKADKIATP
jgi:HNH endonuclease